jgi:NADH-quinone oxidoreductase subunit L
MPEDDASITGLPKLIYNKFYVDEMYNNMIVVPLFKMSEWFGNFFDKQVVDRAVNGTASMMDTGGKTLRQLQTGNTGFYVFAMVIGMVVLFIIRLLI